MAKEKADKATIDILNPNQHGGFRSGAGRKKGQSSEKVKIGWRVSKEAIDNIEALARNEKYSASDLLDYLMRNLKIPPVNLE